MGKKYAKPPLVEAVCEFRFSEDTKWDMTVAGLLFEKVKSHFPIKEQRLLPEFQITQGPDGIQQKITTEERIHLFNEARNAFIQVGSRVLAINCLKPYPEWDNFNRYILQAFNALCEVIDVKGANRIGLRYINRIEIPNDPNKDNVLLDHYFDYRPFLGDRLPQRMIGFVTGVTLPFEDDQDICRITLTNAVAELPKHQAVNLDLDYSSHIRAVPFDKISKWIEVAHSNLESAFEACISDKLRELFQEVK